MPGMAATRKEMVEPMAIRFDDEQILKRILAELKSE